MTSVRNITSAFECNYCDKEYTIRTSLQSHLRTKHKKKVAENIEKTEAIKMSHDIVNEVVDNAQKTSEDEFEELLGELEDDEDDVHEEEEDDVDEEGEDDIDEEEDEEETKTNETSFIRNKTEENSQ